MLFRSLRHFICAVFFCAASFPLFAQTGAINVDVVLTTGSAHDGFVEFAGVEAGEFDPVIWQSSTRHLLPDIRHPFMSPLAGTYRNIYAPSAVETPSGYRFFYGAWDGLSFPPKDRIYSGTTDFEFLTVQNRKTIVMPGTFGHVCNVNALGFSDGSYRMFGTVEFTANPHKNRPAFFWSDTTGTNWNGTTGEPYTVQTSDFISISGYTNDLGADKFPASDINGINVMVHEEGVYRLYFSDFQDAPTGFKTYRATSANGKNYSYDGIVLNQDQRLANDVKKFRVNNVDWYLMGLHFNGFGLWSSLSTNGASFPTSSQFLSYLDAQDRYIVAMGWVVRGEENQAGRRLTGVLYGAGATSSLDQNRIFARWLQKKVVFVADDGTRYSGTNSLGPNRQLLKFPETNFFSGFVEVYNENGATLLGRSLPFRAKNGQKLELKFVPVQTVAERSTGVGTNGELLEGGAVDPHFQLISSADANYPGPNAIVVQPLPSTFGATGTDSKWIAPRMNATNSPGIYIYRTTLPIEGVEAKLAMLEARLLYDNIFTNLTVNGISRTLSQVTATSNWRTIAVTDDLVEGTNTIDFMIRNSGSVANRTGFRAEIVVHASDPASFTLPTATVHPQNKSGKYGTNFLLSADGIGSLPLEFQWEFNDAPLPGETNSTLLLLNVQPEQSGEYRARIRNIAGEVYTSAADVQISPPIAPVFQSYSANAQESNFAFSISGESGDRYVLETSTNLLHWFLVRNLTNVSGTLSVVEPIGTNATHFYRLQIPQ